MTLAMNCVRTPPKRVVDSKRMGSEKPNIITSVQDLSGPICLPVALRMETRRKPNSRPQ